MMAAKYEGIQKQTSTHHHPYDMDSHMEATGIFLNRSLGLVKVR